ncbi:hypothetical protein [Enterobacter cloacae complex sp. 288G10]|uniref:hypothetical protein n=1 Tax=Enterobacter cloacae complex sp. 288G10 TaxID=3395859 RepID=UPI003CED4563
MDAVAVEQNWFATRWQIAFRHVPLHCSSGRRQSWKIWQKSDFKSPSALSV